MLASLLISSFSHASLIVYNEVVNGDLSDTSLAPVNSGDTLQVTGSAIQVSGGALDFDRFTVTLLDDFIVNVLFEVIDTPRVVDFTSDFGTISSPSGLYENYASGAAGVYSFNPVPQGNNGTVNYIYTFIVGEQVAQVPEPATILLFGLGLAGLAHSRKRKVS